MPDEFPDDIRVMPARAEFTDHFNGPSHFRWSESPFRHSGPMFTQSEWFEDDRDPIVVGSTANHLTIDGDRAYGTLFAERVVPERRSLLARLLGTIFG